MDHPHESAAPRVLIVDDDVSVSDMFSRNLRLEGFEVWAALSAREGLALASRHHPHAVVIDLRMPATRVIDLVREFRLVQGLAHTPVAVVTSDYYLTDPQSDTFRSLGATLHYKPLWIAELVGIARELILAAVAL